MPSHLPSSFASAAAGQTGQNRDPRGSGEWPRSNGTRTFRRPSTTPFNQSSQPNATDAAQSPNPDPINTSASSQNPLLESLGSLRYTKDELLEVAKGLHDSAQIDVASLFIPGWNPAHLNGSAARGWGKNSDHAHVPQDPGVCWDTDGLVRPMGLQGLSAEEKDLFNSDVNSTLKPPQQSKEGNHQGISAQNGRKASISHGSISNYATSSPSTASRPGTRRRETTDTNPFSGGSVASPTAARFPREEQSPWFARKSMEAKEQSEEPEEESASAREPAGSKGLPSLLTRSSTTGTSGFGGGTSLWGSNPTTAGVGAFGSFALPTPSAAAGDKRIGAGRGESRLAHLMPKDSDTPVGGKPAEGASSDARSSWRQRHRTDTDPFGEDAPSGSAALGGAQDTSPPPQGQRHGVFDTPMKNNAGDFGMAGLSMREGLASPSDTNPYRSPAGEQHQEDENEGGMHPSGLASEQPSNFSTLSRAFGATGFDGSDRSQTSSVGAKGYPGIGNLTGWPAGPSSGTPDRDRPGFASAFGSSIFSPVGELQSPGLGGMGGVFGPSTGGSLRGSKLGSLFPAAMQAQMQSHDPEGLNDSVPDLRQTNPLGAIARGAIGTQPRETDSPLRTTRGAFEDLFAAHEASRSPFTSVESQPGLTATSQAHSFNAAAAAQSFPGGQSMAEPAAAQPRQMVMPDRMRWVYLDPQGQMQGPFSGLEMNDWYKAQFFSPDLRVKKVEDPDFEPLGQLIRRIGNSREPFLVPQMGIPHGQPSQNGPFPGSDGRGVVPPLQGAFPTFGRTLTADEQNALERKKQEDQLMAAQQREMMHHHQMYQKFRAQGGPGSLQHHSSAHSLQSQPSFGSISSPIGIPPQAPIGAIGPNAGFFEPPINMGPGGPGPGPLHLPGGGPELFNADRQVAANLQGAGGLAGIFGQSAVAPGGEGSLRSQLPSLEQLEKDPQGFKEKLHEFQNLRAQHDAEESAKASAVGLDEEVAIIANQPASGVQAREEEVVNIIMEVSQSIELVQEDEDTTAQAEQPMSLTQQVRKTQADAAAAAAAAKQQAEELWAAQSASGLPMPFPPPPQSTTPLPAPTAQRARSKLPAQYGERSATGTPDTTSEAAAAAPPPTAPWAPQPGTEASHKGPSLKEIQEAEAKKAAKAEEVAAAARRLATEQQAAALREREKAAATASGLAATSTWGTGSPVSATGGTGSPWAKPAAKVVPVPTNAQSKKTLADIQREEEARKQKARDLAVQSNPTPQSSMGKRYADLASKVSAPGAPAAGAAGATAPGGGGWSTVGAGGKVRIPTGPAAQARAASASNAKPPSTAPVAKAAPRPPNPAAKDAGGAAMDEFNKWLHRELSRGLIGVADIDSFASTLMVIPLDQSMIADAVYAYSTTMDGRHFGEEFVRRKKLADKGVVEKQPSAAAVGENKNSSNGGWNEVAKKGGSSTHKDDANIPGSQFKVVPGRKKGKK
ncbi:hypothetical protein GQ53DRAFT_750746 [Thozetella sp. PMI_491]|nr:hypothetical protein GQ53DRAFT_750746 [Thozetella sp. PMI_491]